MSEATNEEHTAAPSDFVRTLVRKSVGTGTSIVTRFPPEPNGYPHIGHAKSICLNFGLAQEFGGRCHLRFDDTNPSSEDIEYVEAMKHDIEWLGFDWGEHLYFASDYFQQLYDWAVVLIKDGKAFVDSCSEEEIRAMRGTVKQAGTPSPHRERSVEENLELFERMRRGEFDEGAHVLRAKIGLDSPNMKMRDPLMYRIRKVAHYRTGTDWPIYPFYDWAHGQSDAIEGITHSLCTLEFENNRELYDWYLAQLPVEKPPKQTEFARLRLNYTVMSKRKLLKLVKEGKVEGWDDPRMPTLAGFRRRGYTPSSIREFCDRIGVARANSTVDMSQLESAIRDDLNPSVPRAMAVLRPLKIVLENYPEDQVEMMDVPNYPDEPDKMGWREVPFARELYIERDDFMEDAPKKFFRLAPGKEVRLRRAYIIKCNEVIKDAAGEIVELRCSYDPETRSGEAPDGRKVKGTIHWVSAKHAIKATVRLYDRLFSHEDPDSLEDFTEALNPSSLETLTDARLEPSLGEASAGTHYQFERIGFFVSDSVEHQPNAPVYNRVVALRDGWAKVKAKG